MKLALLGADADAQLLAAAARAAGHQLTWVGDAADAVEAFGPTHANHEWEDLLDADVAEGVIVGRGDGDSELRSRQVQELVKQGRAVLTSFPLFDSVLSFFEVDMARGESGAVVRHFNPVLASAPIEWLKTLVERPSDELGRLEQILCERPLIDRSRTHVLRHFARDVELLDAIVGGLDRVGAHGAAATAAEEPGAYAGLSVQLSGRTELPVRWSVQPAHAMPRMRLTLVGERGRATVEFDEQGGAVAAALQTAAGEQPRTWDVAPAAATAISDWTREIAHPNDGGSTWPGALHAMELTDSIEISLRRGRMIDVHGQQLTEQLAFRGTMAAAGCALLLVVPPLLLLIGWVAGLLGIPTDDSRLWAPALLALLGLFLAIQLLPKLIYPPNAKPPGDGDRKPEETPRSMAAPAVRDDKREPPLSADE